MKLDNKHVLLLCPRFFNYEKDICSELLSHNALVDYINCDLDNKSTTLVGCLKKINIPSRFIIKRFENYINKQIVNKCYDYVIVICGRFITFELIEKIKRYHLKGNGRMILYYWDSLSLLNDDISKWKLFDRVFTFDYSDYEQHRPIMSFLPLFYNHSYSKQSNETSVIYDVFTVGTFKFNRYYEVELIKKENPGIIVESYMYESKWLLLFHKLLRPKYKSIDLKNIRFNKLSAQEIIKYFEKTKAVLDIPKAGQNGLTMRTIECLGMEKKIITTNKSIANYDFYDDNNIYIMDSSFKLPNHEWFNSKYKPIPPEIYNKYSISSWINRLLYE